ARKAKIANILDELKTVLSTDINKTLALYIQLTGLEPANQEYKKKREGLAKQVADANQKKQRESEQRQRQAEERAALGGLLADLHKKFNATAQGVGFDIRMPAGKCTEMESARSCSYMLTGNIAAIGGTIRDKRT